MRSKNIIIGVLLGGALAAGIFVATTLNVPAQVTKAFIIPTPDALPEFALVDQSTAEVTADTFRGQWDLLFFGFTNCPDICPTTLQILANAKRELIDSGAESLPRIVLVSVDPARDTPEVLGQYVEYFGEDNLAVTGDLAEIVKLTSALGIYFEKSSTEGENYTVNHSAAVLVINPQAEFAALFSAPHVVENYVHDLPIIMGKQ